METSFNLLIFEDSPTCLKDRCNPALCSDCLLLDFVSEESRHEAGTCGKIPLNKLGTTLHTLYRVDTYDQIREAGIAAEND